MKKINLAVSRLLSVATQGFSRFDNISAVRSGLWRRLIVCSLVLCLFPACAKLDLTPVVSTPTGVYHQGKFVWYDLLTADVEGAEEFYGNLFGWGAEEFYGNLFGWSFNKQGRYTVISNKKKTIGGIVEVKAKDKEIHAARWLAALSVPDVDKAVAFVRRAGGVIHEGPVDMENRGRGALVRDPQGAQLVLLHASGGDPEDTDPEIGAWLWVELWSPDLEASLAFYKELGGYETVAWKDDYRLLKKGDKLRGGIRYIPEKDLEVRWVPTVRVADSVVTSRYAEMLGGRVLIEPGDVTHNESAALIEGPAGALFVVQQWEKPAAAGE